MTHSVQATTQANEPPDRRQRLYRINAIVLKRRNYAEADRLLTVFTPELGKLVLLAKGVRKTLSRKAGHVELFTHSNFLVARGRTWDLVTQAETLEPFVGLRGDLLRLAYAYYVAELLDGFTEEHDAQPPLFSLLRETLNRLASIAETALPLAVRYYEMRLLSLAGYQPQLFHCVECREPLEPVTNYMSFADGGVLCPRHGEGKVGTEPLALGLFKTLRFIQSSEWEQVARLNLGQGLQNDVERLLQGYIIYQLERNVRSAAFIKVLREQIAQARVVTD